MDARVLMMDLLFILNLIMISTIFGLPIRRSSEICRILDCSRQLGQGEPAFPDQISIHLQCLKVTQKVSCSYISNDADNCRSFTNFGNQSIPILQIRVQFSVIFDNKTTGKILKLLNPATKNISILEGKFLNTELNRLLPTTKLKKPNRASPEDPVAALCFPTAKFLFLHRNNSMLWYISSTVDATSTGNRSHLELGRYSNDGGEDLNHTTNGKRSCMNSIFPPQLMTFNVNYSQISWDFVDEQLDFVRRHVERVCSVIMMDTFNKVAVTGGVEEPESTDGDKAKVTILVPVVIVCFVVFSCVLIMRFCHDGESSLMIQAKVMKYHPEKDKQLLNMIYEQIHNAQPGVAQPRRCSSVGKHHSTRQSRLMDDGLQAPTTRAGVKQEMHGPVSPTTTVITAKVRSGSSSKMAKQNQPCCSKDLSSCPLVSTIACGLAPIKKAR